jgi:hypothetical protein
MRSKKLISYFLLMLNVIKYPILAQNELDFRLIDFKITLFIELAEGIDDQP